MFYKVNDVYGMCTFYAIFIIFVKNIIVALNTIGGHFGPIFGTRVVGYLPQEITGRQGSDCYRRKEQQLYSWVVEPRGRWTAS